MIDQMHLDRLLPEAREMLDKSPEERIYYINQDRWIPYAEADRILGILENLLKLPVKSRAPSLLITGRANSGKSCLVEHFRDLHPPTDGVYETACPVYYLSSCPPDPDEGRLYDDILSDLGIPFRPSDKPSVKMGEVVFQFRQIGAEVVILDEIGHSLTGSVTKQRVFMNSIKKLHNQVKKPIVLVGTLEAKYLNASDEQFESRFRVEVLKPWVNDVAFKRFLAQLELSLPFKNPSLLASHELSEIIFNRAGSGCLGDFISLVSSAAAFAVTTGLDKITLNAVKECYFVPISNVTANNGAKS